MKKLAPTIFTCISLTLLSTSVFAQEEDGDEPTPQEQRRERLEERRSMTEEERQARREQARERFESLSAEEQARVKERRQRMRGRRQATGQETESL
ncbi:MAG: hypothetical protein AB8B95_08200 [Pseudohongiellaceae bacterium]